jgi:hypothetical protein
MYFIGGKSMKKSFLYQKGIKLCLLKSNATRLIKSEGGFAIKDIAIALGSIIIVGVFIAIFRNQAGDIFTYVWNAVKSFIENNIK